MSVDFEKVVEIAQQAGDIILSHYHQKILVTEKADHSPVTVADLAANRHIITQLQALDSSIPILSEESEQPSWKERQTWQRFWLVDPLDGTKEFIQQNGDFTVNIALIENGLPVFGVVHAPALGKTWLGDGRRAWVEAKGIRDQIKVRPATIPTVIGSRSHPSAYMEAFLEELGEHKWLAVGSSLKFCLIAEGRAQSYPRLGPTMMWDTAAGQCVATSAGANIKTWLDNTELNYHREDLLNPFFVVSV